MMKNNIFNLLIYKPLDKITFQGIFNDVYWRYIFYLLTPILINISCLIYQGCPISIVTIPLIIFSVFTWFILNLHKRYTTLGLDIPNVFFLFLKRLIVFVIFTSSLIIIDVLCILFFEQSFFDLYIKLIIFSTIILEECFVFCAGSSGGNSIGSASNPSGGGSNTPGNGGGSDNPGLVHDNSDTRSRRSSTGSSWSAYSDEIHADDTPFVRDRKFANFIYDVECKKRYNQDSTSVLDRGEFDRSNLNPLNWNTSDSLGSRRLSWEVERMILDEHNRRLVNTTKNPYTFSLKQIGIDAAHPLHDRVRTILFPGLHPGDSRVLQGIVYSPEVGVDRLKAIRSAK